jgi:hypothetical protein
MHAQVIEIAKNSYGPLFIPNLVKPCRNADDALFELLQFCMDPNAWYSKNKIPEMSVRTARARSNRIRTETLYQNYVEVFDRPNSRLSR